MDVKDIRFHLYNSVRQVLEQIQVDICCFFIDFYRFSYIEHFWDFRLGNLGNEIGAIYVKKYKGTTHTTKMNN